MSKIANDLQKLNEARKNLGSVVLEDAAEGAQDNPVQKHGSAGIIVLSVLVIVMTALSAFSMSVSLKTYDRLEAFWADTKAVLATLDQQGHEVRMLQASVQTNSAETLGRIEEVKNGINDLKIALKERDQAIGELKMANKSIRDDLEFAIGELKTTDDYLLENYQSLDGKVSDVSRLYERIMNTY